MVNFEPPPSAKQDSPEFRLPEKAVGQKLKTSLKADAAEESSEVASTPCLSKRLT